MRQADLARLGVDAAAHEGHVAHRVVRRAEGAHGYQRVFLAHQACHGVYLRRLQAFAERKRRQDAGHALGQHGLARARRAYHDGVVATGSGNLQAALDSLLPFDVGEVVLVAVQRPGELGAGVDDGLRQVCQAVEVVRHLLQALGAVDLQVVHYGGLAGVFDGDDDALAASLPRLDGDGQHALDGAQSSVQPQLAHDDIPLQLVGL